MKTKVLFSSQSDEWETPQDLFDQLDSEFGFNLDVCANDENHKCPVYITKDHDALTMDWGGVLRMVQSALLRDKQVGKEVLLRRA